MRALELKDKSTDALQQREESLKVDVFNLKLKLATEQLTNTAKLRTTKRDLARIKTLLRERQLGIVPDPESGGAVEDEEA
ncbi:MAG: 50S ribosomal protein L29 [Deltaproteobacteria bacterium]|nr:50S ribosomal protein L29 [Deltaproteobacteria bacterium]